ncbi:MAG TPA: hypothetical protein ENK96_01855 [Desulfobulbaceae bacterium]|nr:hypothetical protein [Desulfobulbaceae bacterium]
MDEKIIFSYLAEKVIEDIRKGTLKPEIALALRIYPLNDYIRQILAKDDVEHITKLLKDKNDEIKAFALMISRPFQKNESVKQAISDLWKKDKGSFLVGFDTIYRLLEYEDITSERRVEFFDYIKEHWAEWKEKLISCYPEPSRIIPGAKSRIENADFPEWKKWIYLVEVACSPDVDNARDLLAAIDTVNSDFRTKVKKWAISVL